MLGASRSLHCDATDSSTCRDVCEDDGANLGAVDDDGLAETVEAAAGSGDTSGRTTGTKYVERLDLLLVLAASRHTRRNPYTYYVACTTPPLQKFGNYLRSMKKSADCGADQLIDQLIAFDRNP